MITITNSVFTHSSRSVSPSTPSRYQPLLLAGLLLLVFANHVFRLRGVEMNGDEIWTVWQTFGTPQQILAWTPYDWGPMPYFVVAGWRFIGLHPDIIRLLSVLLFMLAIALTYRVAYELGNARTAWLTAITYAASGYAIYASIELRGYALFMLLMPLALWLVLRYFRHPTPWRAWLLAVCLAGMFYIHTTSALAFLMLGLFSVLLYGRRIWRWWLPASMALALGLPEIVGKAGTASGRLTTYNAQALKPFFSSLWELLHFYAGELTLLWAVVLLAAVVLLISQQRPLSRKAIGLLIWVFGGTLLYYFLQPIFNTYSDRHSWWLLLGLSLLIGWGCAYLPRFGVGIVSVLVLGAMFLPLPLALYDIPIPNPPLAQNFEWLKGKILWGDVIVVDPSGTCGAQANEWDYYVQTFFPQGLTFIADPTGYRRVWYVTHDSLQNPELEKQVLDKRFPGIFVGPPTCLFRLYEGAPNAQGTLFENGMRFHGFDVLNADGQAKMSYGVLAPHEGETLRVRLWWSADYAPKADYSVALHVYDNRTNTLIAQSDSAPQVKAAPQETSQWQSSHLYVEDREIVLPARILTDAMGVANFTLYLMVYGWWDNVRVNAPGVDTQTRLLLVPIEVKAWSR